MYNELKEIIKNENIICQIIQNIKSMEKNSCA
jgi:hypothetical protein